jgi:hypothetical protein
VRIPGIRYTGASNVLEWPAVGPAPPVGQWDLYWLTGRQITRDGAKETARWTVASGGGQHS